MVTFSIKGPKPKIIRLRTDLPYGELAIVTKSDDVQRIGMLAIRGFRSLQCFGNGLSFTDYDNDVDNHIEGYRVNAHIEVEQA